MQNGNLVLASEKIKDGEFKFLKTDENGVQGWF